MNRTEYDRLCNRAEAHFRAELDEARERIDAAQEAYDVAVRGAMTLAFIDSGLSIGCTIAETDGSGEMKRVGVLRGLTRYGRARVFLLKKDGSVGQRESDFYNWRTLE